MSCRGQCHPKSFSLRTVRRSDGEALAATATALGVGVGEDEAGGEIVFLPVHHAADQIEDGGGVDVKAAGGRVDLLVERLRLVHKVDRISEARAAAPGGRELDSDGPF